jgi:hypothetical protein
VTDAPVEEPAVEHAVPEPEQRPDDAGSDNADSGNADSGNGDEGWEYTPMSQWDVDGGEG